MLSSPIEPPMQASTLHLQSEAEVREGEMCRAMERERSRKERELVILDDGATRKRAGEIVVLVKQRCACPFQKSVEQSSALCSSAETWDLNPEMSNGRTEKVNRNQLRLQGGNDNRRLLHFQERCRPWRR